MNHASYYINSSMSDLGFSKTDKYLIYSNFTSKLPSSIGGSTVGGSLLLCSANTLEEAQKKIDILVERKREFDNKIPPSNNHRESHFVYIENDPDWWTK